MKKLVLLGLFLAGCGYETHTVTLHNTTVVVVEDSDSDGGVVNSDAGSPVEVVDAGVPDAGCKENRHHGCSHDGDND